MTTRITISLSGYGAERLRQLAKLKGIAVTETIEFLVNKEWNEVAETCDRLPPGVIVSAVADHTQRLIMFAARGLPLVALTLGEAEALLEALVNAATHNKTTVLPKTERGKRLIEVRRQGRGIVIGIDGVRSSMTATAAHDIGQIIQGEMDGSDRLIDGEPTPPPDYARALLESADDWWEALKK